MSTTDKSCDVSVVIVNWNTRELLRGCLRSVYAETREISIEVLVVDNASADGSADMVRSEFSDAHLIANGKNRGFARANNQALQRATGRYVLLLNSDTLVLDGAIDKCVRYADANPGIGALGCRVEFGDGRFQGSYFRFLDLWSLVAQALFIDDALPRNRSSRQGYWGHVFHSPRDVDVIAGCYLLVRREVLESVGLLDEAFFLYGEEAEWCWRIRRAGWRIQYYPGARIIHFWGGSAGQIVDRAAIAKRSGALLFLEKTRGSIYAWLGNLVMTIGAGLRTPLWMMRALLVRLRGGPGMTLLAAKWRLLQFHAAGLVQPVWRASGLERNA